MAFDDTLPQRAEYDHLLMTAHNRASAASDSRAVSHPVPAGVIRHVGR